MSETQSETTTWRSLKRAAIVPRKLDKYVYPKVDSVLYWTRLNASAKHPLATISIPIAVALKCGLCTTHEIGDYEFVRLDGPISIFFDRTRPLCFRLAKSCEKERFSTTRTQRHIQVNVPLEPGVPLPICFERSATTTFALRDRGVEFALEDLTPLPRAEDAPCPLAGPASDPIAERAARAILSGLELIAHRNAKSHGEWMPWIKENRTFSYGAAFKYKRAAEPF